MGLVARQPYRGKDARVSARRLQTAHHLDIKVVLMIDAGRSFGVTEQFIQQPPY
jgi:hypothetical protein